MHFVQSARRGDGVFAVLRLLAETLAAGRWLPVLDLSDGPGVHSTA